jgi:hypothetical protein
MILSDALKQLQALGSAKVRAQNTKSGAGDRQFGVSLGDIRALSKKIRTDGAVCQLCAGVGVAQRVCL